MAYKIKSKKKTHTAYQMNIRGHIVQARTKKELEKKLEKNIILWDMKF